MPEDSSVEVYQKALELLRKDDGTDVSELSDELGVSRNHARKMLSRADDEYELGSSHDFRYRILNE